jgi:broad specificity phosphatase PhoE
MGRVLYGRSPGVHLNERGRKEALVAGGFLKSRYRLDAIVSSPLERAIETAQFVGDVAGLAVSSEEGLNELEFGSWMGKPFSELKDCEEWQHFNRLRSITRAPGGESLIEVQQRAWRSLEGIVARHQDATVAAVTHGDVIRCLLLLLFGMPLDHIARLEIAPASVSEIVLGEGDPLVRSINERPSIEEQRQ